MKVAMFSKDFVKLFTNHMDAWGVTFIIGSVALVVHQTFTLPNLLLPLTVATCYWLGFAVNDYFDAPFDAQDAAKGRRNFFVAHPLSRRLAITLFTLIALAVFAVLAQYGNRSVAVMAAGCLAMWLYSAPPLRLKSRPVFDLLMHMLFVQTFPYAVCVFLLGLQWNAADGALLSIFGLASLAAQLEQQVRDYAVDMRTDRNFTTVYGVQTSSRLLKVMSALLLANFTWHTLTGVIPLPIVPFGLIFLPILLHRFLRATTTPRSERLVRVGVVVALVYAGVLWSSNLLLIVR
jgi:lycopene elongase/hydratase (dihydrobisanhydrobacterioruberin-forming)